MISNKYSIKDLETLSGVKAHTIRIWEKRFNLLVPERTPTNIRLYSDDDLRKIINISTLLNNHFKISKIAGWDEQQINQAVMEVEEKQVSAEAYTEQLKTMLLHFDTRSFTEATKEIMARMGVEDAFTKVFFNLLTKIGVYWQAGAIYPAQEHFATYVFRKQLLAETVNAESNKRNGKTILFFLHENELHEMGLLFYTYLATKHGYNVIYLGAQVPFSDLEKMESSITIDMVFTHFVNPTPLEMLIDYLSRLKSLFKKQTIFISGLQIKKSKITPPGIKIISGYQDFINSILSKT